MSKRALIFVNGKLRNPQALADLIQPDDFLIAADGGARHLLKLGRLPDILIGDLDSLTLEEVQYMEEQGVRIQRHPTDKDWTDLELALRFAVENGYTSIRLVAALGGRLDQTLGNLFLLTQEKFKKLDIALDDGQECVQIIHSTLHLSGKPGDRVSLIPIDEKVTQVSTQGLRWTLHNETLYRHSTRGISNELLKKQASITIGEGLILCIHTRKELLTDEIR